MNIFFAFLVLALLGWILGICLAVASKKLAVPKDEKLVELEAAMPGANCGGCGYAGCSAYAEAVYKGEAKPGLCSPGGNKLVERMAEILGIEAVEMEKMVAFVHCGGDWKKTVVDYKYVGMDDCNAAYINQSGPMACKEGCVHLGSCMKVCPTGAISRDDDGKIRVDKEKCIGCMACTKVCPTHVIRMVPYSAEYLVECNNHMPGGKVRKVCQVGCIGCKICQIKVPDSPFAVENFLSHNDYTKPQGSAPEAAELCPQKCIVKRD